MPLFKNYRVIPRGGLNLRRKPTRASKILKVIPSKTVVKVDEDESTAKWSKVYYKDFEGFVMSEFLKEI